jgi:hypothetical protein
MVVALLASQAGAISSAWVTDGDGYWTNSINWDNGVPNAPGDVAYFTNMISAARYVTIDTNVTIGKLYIGSATNFAWHVGDSSTKTVIMDSGNASRAVLKFLGSQQDYGPKYMAMNVDLEINGNSSGSYFRMTGLILSGSHDVYFNADGSKGTPYMSSSSLYLGNTYLCAGTTMPGGDFFGATTGGVRTVTITNNATYKLNSSGPTIATNRTFVIGVGGAKIDLNGFTLTIPGNGQLSGSNILYLTRVNAGGTLVLGGTNDAFTGQVVVDTGTTLKLNTNGYINCAQVINVTNATSVFHVANKPTGYTIPSGQVVAGIGTNQGVFKVSSATAKLHPGTYMLPGPSTLPGIMTIDGSLSFENSGVYAWELKQLKDDAVTSPGTTTFSTINMLNGTATLTGGKLEINYLGGISPASSGTGYWKTNHVWSILSAPVPPSGTLSVKDGLLPNAFFKTQISGNTLQLVYTYGQNSTLIRIY